MTYESKRASVQMISMIRSLCSLLIARGPCILHGKIVLSCPISKRIKFVIRRRIAPSPMSSTSSGITPVGLHGDRQRRRSLNVRHRLRTNGCISRSLSRNDGRHPLRCRELSTVVGTDDFFKRQVAKAYIRKSCAEL